MFTSLTVVSFFFAFAWLQQCFLNRLMKADLEALQSHPANSPTHSNPPS
ncbi:hypothetical protein [Leptolyngbya iicbica]|uniref:Uncharacterized protein n=1 Tax=Lyngbya confervoides BDU141951 TaxID=1574623 RepID=A0A8T6QRU2_9CYAN|nr:hypothetical protein [Leptolyngbya sp. LK]